MNLFGKKPTLKEEMRTTDREMRKAGREIERDRRELEREEKKLELEIKNAARLGNKQACTVLAKQLVQIRKQKERTYAANSKIQSLNAQTKTMGANMKLAGAMTTATDSMAKMNTIMKPEQLGKTMQEFGKASAKMGMTEELMNDALDDILNESGDEEESDAIVQQVLDEIGIDVSAKVARAPAAHGGKVGVSAKDELADLEQQLAKLKA